MGKAGRHSSIRRLARIRIELINEIVATDIIDARKMM